MENSEHTSFHCYLFLVSFFLLYLYMLKTNFFFQKDYLISIFFAKLSNRCILRIHIKYCKSILNKLNQAGKAKRVSSQLQFNQYYYRNLKNLLWHYIRVSFRRWTQTFKMLSVVFKTSQFCLLVYLETSVFHILNSYLFKLML